MSEATRPTPETRQRIIDALCESFARDAMEMGELENRPELVHQAETAGELRPILADLPASPVPVKGEGAASSPASDVPPLPTLPDDRIPDHSMIVGIIGGGGRSGTWIPARNNWAVGVMGGCEFDFRDAQLGAGVTEVRVLAFMGAVAIIAPPDAQVESSGVGIIGGFGISNHYRPPTHPPGRTHPAGYRRGVHGQGRCLGAKPWRDCSRRPAPPEGGAENSETTGEGGEIDCAVDIG